MNYQVTSCVNGYILETPHQERIHYPSAESMCSSLLGILQLRELSDSPKGGIPGFIITDARGKSIKMTPIQLPEFQPGGITANSPTDIVFSMEQLI